MYKLDGNPCYRTGALWKTRTKIAAYRDLSRNEQPVVVPKGEVIMLLGYIIRPTNEESIHFLWNQKVLYAKDIDAGLQFLIDPNGVNTQNHLLANKKP